MNPILTVFGGPNGAGKSTLSNLLKEKGLSSSISYNPDEMDSRVVKACHGNPYDPVFEERVADLHSQFYYEDVDKAIKDKQNFALESNLRDVVFDQIYPFEQAGYDKKLVFLMLDSVEESRARVQYRVNEKGHFIDDASIKTNFEQGLKNLNKTFLKWDELQIFKNNFDVKTGKSLESNLILHLQKGKIVHYDQSYNLSQQVKEQIPHLLQYLENNVQIQKQETIEKPNMRVFAGPNGSGKSTVYNELKQVVDCGHYINPDEVLIQLQKDKHVDMKNYGLTTSSEEFWKYSNSQVGLLSKALEQGMTVNVQVENSCIKCDNPNAYESALISGYIREKFIENKKSFTTETVLSHPSKLEQIKEGKAKGYNTELYFVCLDSPEKNKERVKTRHLNGGHDVPPELIKSRYKKTLELSHSVAKEVDVAYFIDNSKKKSIIVGKMEKGKLTVFTKEPPKWFKDNIINKCQVVETNQTIKAEVNTQQNIFKNTHKGLSM